MATRRGTGRGGRGRAGGRGGRGACGKGRTFKGGGPHRKARSKRWDRL